MPGSVMASEFLFRHYLMSCCSGMSFIVYITIFQGKRLKNYRHTSFLENSV